MKVGTDGVLLGAWTNVENVGRVLDIGTGTGLLALMIAQRSAAKIDAVEIDQEAFLQAKENIQKSPWKERIDLHHKSIQEYPEGLSYKYDLIICNPPFFQNSLKAPDQSRSIARHNERLDLSELLFISANILNPSGRLSIVIPADILKIVLKKAGENNFYLNRKTLLKPTPEKAPKRALLEFGLEKKELEENEIVIELERHQYSKAFKGLSKDFYLNL